MSSYTIREFIEDQEEMESRSTFIQLPDKLTSTNIIADSNDNPPLQPRKYHCLTCDTTFPTFDRFGRHSCTSPRLEIL